MQTYIASSTSSGRRPQNARAARNMARVVTGMLWAYAMLWPVAAIVLLAFVFSDPAMSPFQLGGSLVAVAAGSGIAAMIDGWLLSSESWWTVAHL